MCSGGQTPPLTTARLVGALVDLDERALNRIESREDPFPILAELINDLELLIGRAMNAGLHHPARRGGGAR
jgi:hypothetical protein